MQKIITINEDVRDQIQALQYEVDSRKDLLTFMVDKGCDVSSDSFKAYHKEYQEFHIQYEAAKEEMQKQILEPAVPGKLIRWDLNFATCQAVCVYEEK